MAKLKDLSKAQVLYDALMIVTSGKKQIIREICNVLQSDDGYITDLESVDDSKEISSIAGQINFHLIQQGY